MASGLYVTGAHEIVTNGLDIDDDTIKAMLVDDNYVFDNDHDFVGPGTADSADLAHNEINATNYTRGFGGAGRLTTTITASANKTSNRVDLAIADLQWTSLGGASNDTVGGCAIIKEIVNDAQSRPIAFFDHADQLTDGNNFSLDFAELASGGSLRLQV